MQARAQKKCTREKNNEKMAYALAYSNFFLYFCAVFCRNGAKKVLDRLLITCNYG